MRLGLSNKITQPHLRGAAEVAEEVIPRYSLTLYAKADAEVNDPVVEFGTYSRKHTDGRYYGMEFPQHWTDLNTSTGAISNDPFEQYRLIKDGETDYVKAGNVPGALGGAIWALSPIDAHLDVTIIVDSDVNLGSNTSIFAWMPPAFMFDISDNVSNLDPSDDSMSSGTTADFGGRWGSRFTIDAAKNLKVTVQNSGNVCGGGGAGGHGGYFWVCGDPVSGGGGGGGAGNHQIPPTVGDVATSPVRHPGQEGDAYASGQNGVEGGLVFGGAGGAGGAQASSDTDNPAGQVGLRGGIAFQNYNPGLYAVDSTAFATVPEYTIINESGGYIYAGSGGGGGSQTDAIAGGAGGGKTDADTIVTNGAAASGTRAAGGAAGKLVGDLFNHAVGGSFVFTNNHDTGNTQVTVQGGDGTY